MSVDNDSNTFETEKVIISLLEGGIVRVYVKEGAAIEEKDLHQFHAIYLDLMENDEAPFVVIFGKYSRSSKEAREKFANVQRAKFKSAEALVLNGLPHRIIANFYIKVYKPKHPTRIFSTEQEGVKWLKSIFSIQTQEVLHEKYN